jgi:hypothetical protein
MWMWAWRVWRDGREDQQLERRGTASERRRRRRRGMAVVGCQTFRA